MANYIQESPWKISFATTGNGPYAVRIKLSDLMFDKTTSLWTPLLTGIHLPHDIILYDPALYNTDSGALIAIDTNREDRQSRGFYLTKVTYDDRAYRTWVVNAAYPNGGYYIYNSDAPLPIIETDYSVSLRRTYFDIYSSPTELMNPALPAGPSNPYMTYQTSCSVAIEGSSAASSSALIVGSPDLVLQATIPGSSLVPFTRMHLQTDYVGIPEVADIVRFLTEYGLDANGAHINDAIYTNANVMDPTINIRLQTAEIWVRCSYFADYIIPDTFNQDLTQTSQVEHKNIVIGLGDFARFSRTETADNTVYLPVTPPRIDVLQISAGDATPFLVPSKSGTYDAAGAGHTAPLGWYDPDYPDVVNAGKLLALPVEGNIYASGRLISPTIDELWTYIKKIVDGRPNDGTTITVGPKSTSASLSTSADTRLPVEPTLTLGTKIGDPLTKTGSSFINAPEGFLYAINANIKYLTDIIGGPSINSAAYYPFADHIATGPMSGRARVSPGVLQILGGSNDWGARANPMSLRELEAEIRNIQFNLELAINWIAANKTSTGNTDSEDTALQQGTLYQLHKSYDPNLDNEANNGSKWSTAASTLVPSETVVNHGSSLPAADGISTRYSNTTSIPQQDVYLSAEGYWRYLFDHVRIPVLNETY